MFFQSERVFKICAGIFLHHGREAAIHVYKYMSSMIFQSHRVLLKYDWPCVRHDCRNASKHVQKDMTGVVPEYLLEYSLVSPTHVQQSLGSDVLQTILCPSCI